MHAIRGDWATTMAGIVTPCQHSPRWLISHADGAESDTPSRPGHEAGEGLHVVAQRLGHKDAMVTATIYAHVTPKQSRQASDTFTRILDI